MLPWWAGDLQKHEKNLLNCNVYSIKILIYFILKIFHLRFCCKTIQNIDYYLKMILFYLFAMYNLCFLCVVPAADQFSYCPTSV